MKEAGLARLIVGDSGETTEEAGYIAARELVDRQGPLTAIFAANDIMALGALAALKEGGLRTPEDVSVLGYDNTTLAESRYLSLTSIDAHNAAIGAEVAKTLLGRLQEPDVPPRQLFLEPTLIARSSTAPPPTIR
jgi:DNA-binding LacI/PurR family transcriptional regulator